jgi:hypothetical protein
MPGWQHERDRVALLDIRVRAAVEPDRRGLQLGGDRGRRGGAEQRERRATSGVTIVICRRVCASEAMRAVMSASS